jgi:hypothetical protein
MSADATPATAEDIAAMLEGTDAVIARLQDYATAMNHLLSHLNQSGVFVDAMYMQLEANGPLVPRWQKAPPKRSELQYIGIGTALLHY